MKAWSWPLPLEPPPPPPPQHPAWVPVSRPPSGWTSLGGPLSQTTCRRRNGTLERGMMLQGAIHHRTSRSSCLWDSHGIDPSMMVDREEESARHSVCASGRDEHQADPFSPLEHSRSALIESACVSWPRAGRALRQSKGLVCVSRLKARRNTYSAEWSARFRDNFESIAR